MSDSKLIIACIFGCLSTTSSAADIKQLVADLDTTRQQFAVPAVGFALVTGEEILYAGSLGFSNIRTNEPTTEDTIYRIGSITKTFTALALLLAAEKNLLQLNDPVRKHAADAPYTNPWATTHPIRVEHLLEHTAGFSDMSWAEFEHNQAAPIRLEDALAFRPESRVVKWKPGMHSSYSNSGAGLAAYVLENCIDQPFETFVTEQLFAPLQMNSASFFLTDRVSERLATGYDTDARTDIPYWHIIFRPSGAINATPRDMAVFVQLLINAGEYDGQRLLAEESITRMETPRTTLAARSGLEYGYGLGNYWWLRNGFVFHGHGGDGDGYLAHYGYNKDTGMGYFVVINVFNHRPLRALRARIENFIVGDLSPPDPMPPYSMSLETLQAFTGHYEPVTRRFDRSSPQPKLHVTLEGGTLHTRIGNGQRRALIPVNPQHFRRPHQSIATIAIVKDETGRHVIQGDLGNFRQLTETGP